MISWYVISHVICTQEVLLERSDITTISAYISKKTRIYLTWTASRDFNRIFVPSSRWNFISRRFFGLKIAIVLWNRWLFQLPSNDCRLRTLVFFQESKTWLFSGHAIMCSYSLAPASQLLCKHARCIWTCSYLGEVTITNRVHRYIW